MPLPPEGFIAKGVYPHTPEANLPQFDMVIITAEGAEELVRRGATVQQHTAGQALVEGGGDETYRCGSCRARLLIDVAHGEAHGALIRCGKCGKVNMEPPHHHG